ncbi:MAG: preprotein translocase subunit YajC [Phycisphaerales bacterium]|nr:MAG: preprotein translocase subunit YajC [Phycisphaerales bacterium]
MNNVWILAQTDSTDSPSGISVGQEDSDSQEQITTAQGDPNQPVDTRRTNPWGSTQFIIIGVMFVIMYLMLFRGPRKKQQQHKQMIQALSKNDKVQTIGGIIGTVVDIKDEEITLKIDESNNTKMKILRSAISRNVSKDKS